MKRGFLVCRHTFAMHDDPAQGCEAIGGCYGVLLGFYGGPALALLYFWFRPGLSYAFLFYLVLLAVVCAFVGAVIGFLIAGIMARRVRRAHQINDAGRESP